MRFLIAAALALLSGTSLGAQAPTTMPDLTTFAPIAGEWSYAQVADGSEAVFTNISNDPQLWVYCSRATRHVSISRAATGPAAAMNVWTSSATRAVPSSFNPTSGRLTIDFTNYDPLLDAIATSRGRLGFAIGDGPALVVPAWAEVARVIEDCRS
jgi:hypothetical protein